MSCFEAFASGRIQLFFYCYETWRVGNENMVKGENYKQAHKKLSSKTAILFFYKLIWAIQDKLVWTITFIILAVIFSLITQLFQYALKSFWDNYLKVVGYISGMSKLRLMAFLPNIFPETVWNLLCSYLSMFSSEGGCKEYISVKKQSFLTTSLSTLTLYQNYTSTQPKL